MIDITAATPPDATELAPFGLTCEGLHEPLGIDALRPRLGWRLASPHRSDRQSGYRITVAATPDDLATGSRLLWDSGWHVEAQQIGVEYDGPRLQSSTRYHWSVTVRNGAGDIAGSANSWFETGLLHDEWQATWIGHDPLSEGPLEPPQDHDRTERTRLIPPAAHLRRPFELPTQPVRARAYVSARGLYELRLNGQRIGDAELAPGWTDYRRRIAYQTYDVTDAVTAGNNVVGAIIADGWWSGYVGFDSRHAAQHYGTAPEFIAELLFDMPDGSQRRVVTDGSWRETDGPIRHADLLHGEYVDARHTLDGWDEPGYDAAAWQPVRVTDADTSLLEASADQPVRVVDELPAQSVRQRSDGTFIVDLGQNMVGRSRLTIRGAEAGRRIQLRFAEMLDDEGGLYVENLRTAEATDVYRTRGAAVEVFEPRFTFHGFRFIEVSNYPGELQPEDVVGVVLQSDTPWSGQFACSDELTNQLVSNLRWGQRGNFLSVPTDCPQRDERLGWMADAQIFLPTAMRNADVYAFFRRWMRDVIGAQHPDGAFPDVVPEVSMPGPGAPAWGDAGVIIPWLLYEEYGDPRILAESLPSMVAWVDYVHRHNPELIWRHRVGRHYADWLQVGVTTPRDVVATAYFAESARLTARSAEVLGEKTLAARYAELADQIRQRFIDTFVADGRVHGDTQTAYLLALAFDLLPPASVEAAGRRLAELIEDNDRHLTTGFLGVALICPILCDIGRDDLAFALLHQDTYPSWNYSIHQGATTIWERWDGWTREHGFQSAAMNSFNHYSLGSVGEWLYGYVAGLTQQPGSVAWSHVRIAPHVGGRLTWAHATQHTVRGVLSSAWSVQDGHLQLEVELPPGTSAIVRVPTSDPAAVTESGRSLADQHLDSTVASGALEIAVPSGRFRFGAPV